MNDLIDDQQQRLQAISAEHSCIVRAPAGSGKTELLIQRYLRLLSLVDNPEEIVAITFTRKAANEMQTRILSALSLAASATPPQDEHRQHTWHLAQAALKRDAQSGWQLQQNPARMKILTIDALCANLVKRAPVLSGLGARVETVEDAQPLYEQAATMALNELEKDNVWSDSIARLLDHLDNDLPRVKRLLTGMLGKRDQWLSHVIDTPQREQLEAALQTVITEKLSQLRTRLPTELETELCEVAAFAALNLQQSNPEHDTANCHFITEYPAEDIEHVPQWLGLSELLLTKSGTWRKQHRVSEGFPAPSDNKAEKEIRSAMKKRVLAVIQQLQQIHGVDLLFNDVRALPPATFTDAEWDVITALCVMLKLAAGQLNLLFSERSQTDFTGVAEAALQALGDDELPTDLALLLDYKLKHLLVDEFQDISAKQHDLLQRLTAGWSEHDGHTLFLVGDPMQSIYRFREAEVGLFLTNWQQRRLGQTRLVPLTLKTNFRSQPGIVEWVNSAFTSILPGIPDPLTGAVCYESSQAYKNIQPMRSVHVYPSFDKSSMDEATSLVQCIQKIRQQDEQETIAVLVRSRRQLILIMQALRQNYLPYQAVDIESLATRTEIQDVLALLTALLRPADRTAWLAILRAPWCGLKLTSLLTLASDSDRTLFACMQDESLLAKLDADESRRVRSLCESLSAALTNLRRHSLHRVLESLWLQIGGPACLADQYQLTNVLIFFDHLAAKNESALTLDIDRLESDLAQLYSNPEVQVDNPVQLMTIHKAKGLEFDHVLLPALGRKTRNRLPELLLWMQLPQFETGNDLILAPIRETGQESAPVYDFINSVEKQKQQHEDARLLYVAVTRAKQSLHLFGHAAISTKDNELACAAAAGSFLHKLWPLVEQDYVAALAAAGAQNEEPTVIIDQNWRRFADEWSVPLPAALPEWGDEITGDAEEASTDEIEYEWASQVIKHIGSVVHAAIQSMAEQGIDNWNSERIETNRQAYQTALLSLGVDATSLASATDQVCQALKNLIEDERGRWCLDSGHEQPQNEYPLSGLVDDRVQHVRLDRTFIDDEGIRWIIDYKTSRHEEADVESFLDREQQRYREQLENYARLMRGLDERPIKLGLYFPLLKGWRSWDAAVN